MAVVGVTHMGVSMLQVSVLMLMGMPEGCIKADVGYILWRMEMVVMGVPSVGVVPVPMGVEKTLVTVPVTVLPPQQHHHACGHQTRGHQQLRREGLPQDDKGDQRAHEGSGGEQHRFAGGAEIAQGQQVEPARDAVTQGTDRK
jgi:hypothetical protein